MAELHGDADAGDTIGPPRYVCIAAHVAWRAPQEMRTATPMRGSRARSLHLGGSLGNTPQTQSIMVALLTRRGKFSFERISIGTHGRV